MARAKTSTGMHGGGGRGGRSFHGGGGRNFRGRRGSSFFIRPGFSGWGWPYSYGYNPYAYYYQLLLQQQLLAQQAAAQQQLLAQQQFGAGDADVQALEQAIEHLTAQLSVLQGQLSMLTARPQWRSQDVPPPVVVQQPPVVVNATPSTGAQFTRIPRPLFDPNLPQRSAEEPGSGPGYPRYARCVGPQGCNGIPYGAIVNIHQAGAEGWLLVSPIDGSLSPRWVSISQLARYGAAAEYAAAPPAYVDPNFGARPAAANSPAFLFADVQTRQPSYVATSGYGYGFAG